MRVNTISQEVGSFVGYNEFLLEKATKAIIISLVKNRKAPYVAVSIALIVITLQLGLSLLLMPQITSYEKGLQSQNRLPHHLLEISGLHALFNAMDIIDAFKET